MKPCQPWHWLMRLHCSWVAWISVNLMWTPGSDLKCSRGGLSWDSMWKWNDKQQAAGSPGFMRNYEVPNFFRGCGCLVRPILVPLVNILWTSCISAWHLKTAVEFPVAFVATEANISENFQQCLGQWNQFWCKTQTFPNSNKGALVPKPNPTLSTALP